MCLINDTLVFVQYKSSPCKKVCVTGWMVLLPDDPARPNIFQLSDPDRGELHTTSSSPAAFFTAEILTRRLFVPQGMFTSSRQDPDFQRSSGTKIWKRLAEAVNLRYVQHFPSCIWSNTTPIKIWNHHSLDDFHLFCQEEEENKSQCWRTFILRNIWTFWLCKTKV